MPDSSSVGATAPRTGAVLAGTYAGLRGAA
jgi:hypothetical protein